MLSGAEPLPPGLLTAPLLRPHRDIAPIPDAALTFPSDRSREARVVGDLAGSLVAHVEKVGDLDDADGLRWHGAQEWHQAS
jgi:hypothetical protein